MALTNKTMYAVLGILDISPSTGYDIKKYCDKVLSGSWNENFGHIYPTLRKMVTSELIELDSKAGEEKKIRYRITEKGRRELESWLATGTKQQPVRSEFMLKLIFSGDQPASQIVDMISAYENTYLTQKSDFQGILDNLEQGIQKVSPERERILRAILKRGIMSAQSTIKWCEETKKEFIKEIQ